MAAIQTTARRPHGTRTATRTAASPALSPLGKAVVDLARLGLQGDSGSTRMVVQRLLRRTPETEDREALRAALAELVVGDEPWRHILRGNGPDAPPIDVESRLPLIREDWPSDQDAPVLPPAIQGQIEAFIDEHLRAEVLRRAGFEPGRSLLFIGPPGTGKTMASRYIARALNLPLLTIDLAGTISSLLGRTGQNLRVALDYARSRSSVLLLDEFDAFAKRRDDNSDVGELKRIVNVLLLELERWPDGSILIAATNHPELLDRAVQRRFDRVVELPLPDEDRRAEILQRALTQDGVLESTQLVRALAAATDSVSGSDLQRLATAAQRRAVLSSETLERALVLEGLQILHQRLKSDLAARRAFVVLAVRHSHMKHREVARLLGVSHPTIGKMLLDAEVLGGGRNGNTRDAASV